MKSYVSPEYKAALGELARDLTTAKHVGQLALQPELPLPFYASLTPEFDDGPADILAFPPTLKLRQPAELGWDITEPDEELEA